MIIKNFTANSCVLNNKTPVLHVYEVFIYWSS